MTKLLERLRRKRAKKPVPQEGCTNQTDRLMFCCLRCCACESCSCNVDVDVDFTGKVV